MDGLKKKVLYISYDGMTDPLGQSQVIPYLKELTKQGYQFTILSVEKRNKQAQFGAQVKQVLDEAGIGWVTQTFTSRPPILSKIYDQWKLNATARALHRQQKFDLIHCRSYVAAEAGLGLSKRFGIPFLFDMRGFWVDERVDSGLWDLKKPLYNYLYKRYKKKEKQYFEKSAHIISLTHKGETELVEQYKIAAEKISVIPCCADLDHFDYRKINEEAVKSTRIKLGINEDAKVLCYLGSLGGWYMTDEMLDFFALMHRQVPASIFLFITHDSKEDIIRRAVDRNIPADAIRVQPGKRNEVPGLLAASQWSLFFIKDVYSKKASSPTKQGEIMAMGIPIVCNDIGDTGLIIKETDAGVVVNGFSEANYSNVLQQMPGLLLKDKRRIREGAARYFDLATGVKAYSRAYDKLINKEVKR